MLRMGASKNQGLFLGARRINIMLFSLSVFGLPVSGKPHIRVGACRCVRDCGLAARISSTVGASIVAHTVACP